MDPGVSMIVIAAVGLALFGVAAVVIGASASKFRFWLTVPMDMRGDIDNRVKPALDFCVAHAITPDDKHAQSVKVERGAVRAGFCTIEIEEAS